MTLQIKIVPEAGSPKTLVREAKKKASELRRGSGDYEVYVVFDRDDHPAFREAVGLARDARLTLGISVPCIELWGLLLHREQTAALDRHRAQSALKKVHKGYCHKSHPYFDPQRVLEGRSHAARRAEHLSRRAVDAGDEFANPTTTFPRVLDSIFQEKPGASVAGGPGSS